MNKENVEHYSPATKTQVTLSGSNSISRNNITKVETPARKFTVNEEDLDCNHVMPRFSMMVLSLIKDE